METTEESKKGRERTTPRESNNTESLQKTKAVKKGRPWEGLTPKGVIHGPRDIEVHRKWGILSNATRKRVQANKPRSGQKKKGLGSPGTISARNGRSKSETRSGTRGAIRTWKIFATG